MTCTWSTLSIPSSGLQSRRLRNPLSGPQVDQFPSGEWIIFRAARPSIERISIDEAFADVAGCTHLFGSPAEIARTVRARVHAQLGLPMSIGVARTKHLAKIASQVAKPDGLVGVHPATELEVLHDVLLAL